MTTFKEIRGKLIRTLDTDPTPATTYEGQIWYNKTIGVLKAAELVAGAFASGGNLSLAREQMAGFGDQTSAVVAGGQAPNTNSTEEYNGASWSGGGNLNTARNGLGGAGTLTAGLAFGGEAPPGVQSATEEYNGTAWTAVNPTIQTQRYGMAFGTQTAAVGAFNLDGPGTRLSQTQEYNGTSWTAGNPGNTARFGGSGLGILTAGLATGGNSGPGIFTGATESYDGTSWTTVNPLSTGRYYMAGSGSQTQAIVWGGNPGTGPVLISEEWDGTNWASGPNDDATKSSAASAGNSYSLGLGAGGQNPPSGPGYLNSTEEWNGPSIQTKTLTTS